MYWLGQESSAATDMITINWFYHYQCQRFHNIQLSYASIDSKNVWFIWAELLIASYELETYVTSYLKCRSLQAKLAS